MYNPPTWMTVEVLAAVLAEFEWPAPYTIEDELPDGILVTFPDCHLMFQEGFESEVSLRFLSEDTGVEDLGLADALHTLGPITTPGLSSYFSPHASLEKVQHGLRDLCTLVLAHLRPCLLGDFSWVERHELARGGST